MRGRTDSQMRILAYAFSRALTVLFVGTLLKLCCCCYWYLLPCVILLLDVVVVAGITSEVKPKTVTQFRSHSLYVQLYVIMTRKMITIIVIIIKLWSRTSVPIAFWGRLFFSSCLVSFVFCSSLYNFFTCTIMSLRRVAL